MERKKNNNEAARSKNYKKRKHFCKLGVILPSIALPTVCVTFSGLPTGTNFITALIAHTSITRKNRTKYETVYPVYFRLFSSISHRTRIIVRLPINHHNRPKNSGSEVTWYQVKATIGSFLVLQLHPTEEPTPSFLPIQQRTPHPPARLESSAPGS